MRRLAGHVLAALALVATLLTSTCQMLVFAPLRSPELRSTNWSGYALQGGHFWDVSGTFSVARAKPVCGDYLSEWVGVDGVSNYDLLQAGIAETGCGGPVQTWAWWEILPAPSVTIPKLPVKPGDVMTVDIRRVGAWRWDVFMADLTTGRYFYRTFQYTGPASSAEWVVEAPMIGWELAPLAPYGTARFSDLTACCRAALLDRVVMRQGTIVSYPTKRATTNELMDDGFVAHYK